MIDPVTICLFLAGLIYTGGGCFTLYLLARFHKASEFDSPGFTIVITFVLWFIMMPIILGEEERDQEEREEKERGNG